MKVQFSASAEDLLLEQRNGMTEPPSESLFIRLVFPVSLSDGLQTLELGSVPVARFALEMLLGLDRLLSLRTSEYVYNDFYGGLTLRTTKSDGKIRFERPETRSFLEIEKEEALAGLRDFAEQVLKFIGEYFPETPGVQSLRDALSEST